MLAFSESRLVRSAMRLIVATMSPISSARTPIVFMTSDDSAIASWSVAKLPIDLVTVVPLPRTTEMVRSARPRASFPSSATRFVVRSSSFAAAAAALVTCSMCCVVFVIETAPRAICSIAAAVDSIVAAFFSEVAATSSIAAATLPTVSTVCCIVVWSSRDWSATTLFERASSSTVAAVSSTLDATSWLAAASSLMPRSVRRTSSPSVAMRSPTTVVSWASRARPFAICSIVTPISSTEAAFDVPRSVMSEIEAAISAAVARSSSLCAARSSALCARLFMPLFVVDSLTSACWRCTNACAAD